MTGVGSCTWATACIHLQRLFLNGVDDVIRLLNQKKNSARHQHRKQPQARTFRTFLLRSPRPSPQAMTHKMKM